VSREEEEAADTLEAFRKSTAEGPKGMGTLGDLLKAKMERKK
jgi:small subunit ribosomal protein S1